MRWGAGSIGKIPSSPRGYADRSIGLALDAARGRRGIAHDDWLRIATAG